MKKEFESKASCCHALESLSRPSRFWAASLLAQAMLPVDADPVGHDEHSRGGGRRKWPKLHTRALATRARRWRRQRASKQGRSSPHPPSPLKHFREGDAQTGQCQDGRTGGAGQTSRVQCGGSTRSTRSVGLEDLEGGVSWLRHEHSPMEDLGACRGWATSASGSDAPPV
eukprot:4822456-Pleurochrysis_carterae.AAC.1